MYTDKAKNNMLDAIGVTHASLHTAYSLTGANEVTGGSPAYARKAQTFAAAASGSKAQNGTAPVFDVPATTVRWVGMWDALTAGNFLGMTPNGGSEKEYIADATADTITSPAHGYADGDKVVFYRGTVPAGLTEGTVYFVRDSTTNTFKVAATAGGAAIDLTAANTYDSIMSKIVEEVYGAQGTHTVTAATLNLNA